MTLPEGNLPIRRSRRPVGPNLANLDLPRAITHRTSPAALALHSVGMTLPMTLPEGNLPTRRSRRPAGPNFATFDLHLAIAHRPIGTPRHGF